ncbi:MAG: glycosyltransferase family 2 protein [Calditrichia bacterium]
MIPVLFLIINSLLAVLLCIALVNSIWGPRLSRNYPLQKQVAVSLLVPARNEARNIKKCLRSLQRQYYSNLEILVLDDQSNDATATIVRQLLQDDPCIRLIEGKPLPEGWTGKNWACHQLSQTAKGDIFIFTDADNFYHPEAVSHTVGWMQHFRLALLSAFPQQITGTIWERLVIPIIDIVLFGGLPLWLTYYFRSPELSAANGQWIAFQKSAYSLCGGHSAVRNEIVEDVSLARLAKKEGLPVLTLSGTGMVFGRMYRSAREVWEGFSKNLFGLTGYRDSLLFFITAVSLLIFVLPYVLIPFAAFRSAALTAVLLNMALRGILIPARGHPVLTSLFLHPFGILATLTIALNSYIRVKKGAVTWKMRSIPVAKSKISVH